jgi:hypothetical protein
MWQEEPQEEGDHRYSDDLLKRQIDESWGVFGNGFVCRYFANEGKRRDVLITSFSRAWLLYPLEKLQRLSSATLPERPYGQSGHGHYPAVLEGSHQFFFCILDQPSFPEFAKHILHDEKISLYDFLGDGFYKRTSPNDTEGLQDLLSAKNRNIHHAMILGNTIDNNGGRKVEVIAHCSFKFLQELSEVLLSGVHISSKFLPKWYGVHILRLTVSNEYFGGRKWGLDNDVLPVSFQGLGISRFFVVFFQEFFKDERVFSIFYQVKINNHGKLKSLMKLLFISLEEEPQDLPRIVQESLQQSQDLITLRSSVRLKTAIPVMPQRSLKTILKSAFDSCFREEDQQGYWREADVAMPQKFWKTLQCAPRDWYNKKPFTELVDDADVSAYDRACGYFKPDILTAKRILEHFVPPMEEKIDLHNPLRTIETLGHSNNKNKYDTFFWVVAQRVFVEATYYHMKQIRRFISIVCYQLSCCYFDRIPFFGPYLARDGGFLIDEVLVRSVFSIHGPTLQKYQDKIQDINLVCQDKIQDVNDVKEKFMTLQQFKKVMKMYSTDVLKPGMVPGSAFEAFILSATFRWDIKFISFMRYTEHKINQPSSWYRLCRPDSLWFSTASRGEPPPTISLLFVDLMEDNVCQLVWEEDKDVAAEKERVAAKKKAMTSKQVNPVPNPVHEQVNPVPNRVYQQVNAVRNPVIEPTVVGEPVNPVIPHDIVGTLIQSVIPNANRFIQRTVIQPSVVNDQVNQNAMEVSVNPPSLHRKRDDEVQRFSRQQKTTYTTMDQCVTIVIVVITINHNTATLSKILPAIEEWINAVIQEPCIMLMMAGVVIE